MYDYHRAFPAILLRSYLAAIYRQVYIENTNVSAGLCHCVQHSLLAHTDSIALNVVFVHPVNYM